MRNATTRTRAALALLALMALMVLPRTWFHECAHTDQAVHKAGEATLAADGHCPICDHVQPHYVVPTTAPVMQAGVINAPLIAHLPEQPVHVAVDAGCTRGPPTC